MNKFLMAILMSAVSTTVFAEQCQPERLGAKYKLTQTHSAPASEKSRLMNLWRMQGLVAHVYPQQEITEVWNQVKDGRIRPVRYFDHDKRAIEYAPGDLNRGKGDRNWDGKYQMISADLLLSMTTISESGTGCLRQVNYQRQSNGETLQLTWLPELKLVKYFQQTRGDESVRWQLLEMVSDQNKISQQFTSREKYTSTDYADIGDNETDPFFRKMINLGFVSHGASGFYDAAGNALDGDHGDHHH